MEKPGGTNLQKQENNIYSVNKNYAILLITCLGKHFVFSHKRNKNMFLLQMLYVVAFMMN